MQTIERRPAGISIRKICHGTGNGAPNSIDPRNDPHRGAEAHEEHGDNGPHTKPHPRRTRAEGRADREKAEQDSTARRGDDLKLTEHGPKDRTGQLAARDGIVCLELGEDGRRREAERCQSANPRGQRDQCEEAQPCHLAIIGW